MAIFFLFVVVILLAFWILMINERNKQLLNRIEALERYVKNSLAPEKQINEVVSLNTESTGKPIPEIPEAEQQKIPETKEPSPYLLMWNKFEKQIVENWTGILGAVIMVTGVSFLGIYAAFKLTPFYRFLMVIGFSFITGGLFFYLKPKPKWIKLALWLRSSSGAIFLFACLGAGGFQGLKWIDDPLYALLLLISGILVNLGLSYFGGRQVFASLHVVLSLLALSIAPQNNLTFIIGTIITLFGVGLTYREKWDYHLLLTISGYFVYHLFWYFSIKDHNYSLSENITGIVSIIAVSILCVFVHYRKTYRTGKFSLLPFSVHLLNWIYTGTGLLYHTTGSKWKTVYIFAVSVSVFFLARTAKKNSVKWLHTTDTLTSLLMAVIAVITLYNWDLNTTTITGIIFLLIVLFLVIMIIENEDLLYRIGTYMGQAAGLILLISALAAKDFSQYGLMLRQSIILVICSAGALGFHLFSLEKKKEDTLISRRLYEGPEISVIAILSGFMALFAYSCLAGYNFSEYVMLILIPFMYLRQRSQSLSLGISTLLLLTGMPIVFWGNIFSIETQPFALKIIHVVPAIVVSLTSIIWSYSEYNKKQLKWIGIYLFSLNLMISGYFLFNNISLYLTGIWWLLLSLTLFETAGMLHRGKSGAAVFNSEAGRFFLHAAYFLIAAFVMRYFLVDVFYSDTLGIFRLRLLTGILAAAVFLYLSIRPAMTETGSYKSRQYLFPLLTELILLFVYSIAVQEVPDYLFSFLLIVMSAVLLYLGIHYRSSYSRLRFYSLIFCWMSALQVVIYSYRHFYDGSPWYRLPGFTGGVTIFFQLCYLYFFYTRNDAGTISFPPSLKIFSALVLKTKRHISKWAFYPVIITTAWFLFLTFDSSVLTLLWVLEAFIIFILSIVLKERYFRYSALLLTGISIFRLMFYDLSYADTITRAFVFLGVGIIMLLMNSVFNRYKDRFIL